MKEQRIRELLKDIVGKERSVMLGSVVSTDENKGLCAVSPVGSEVTINDIRVRSLSDKGNGIYIIPKKDSKVLIENIDGADNYHVLEYGEISKIIYKSSTNKLVIDSENDEILVNEGKNGGLIKIQDLVKKMNEVEKKLNTVISKFNSHTHSGVTTGGSVSGTTPNLIPGTLQPTKVNEIENKKVKH